ncbi:hypothetical protein [Pseudonocardia sp. KRD291]|uniref:hypothetical protein n=1 Tax=Pseudonocardia sp. KRD291 TaxID=2792007 RepID=UPI001C4A1C71|nr:hypothetical protein [Pseudonocardia sp. KRD291]MBW0106310.1 hypothetical protein [Pseudonocardia sp. KRD291]
MGKTTPRPAAPPHRRQWWVRIGFALGAVLVVLGVIGLATRPAEVSPLAPLPTANGYGATTVPPWPGPADPAPGMRAAGLPISDMSAMAQHFHAHLDVIVAGRPVPVPADLGVDQASGQMSALHTHDATGLVHVESSDPGGRYTLGQLFNEWNVALDATRIGGLRAGAGMTLRGFVDGVEVPGNPAAVELRDHQQIALVYGPSGSPVTPPATYDFSNA